ncbi:MAG: FtsX-like permease family protein [Ilyomonas sp.]
MKLLFAWRYFKSKKSTNAINIIAWISVLAIAVGTAALIIVLSVFNGFEDLVKNLYGDFYSDVRIAPSKGKFIDISDAQLQKIRSVKGVKSLSLVVEEKAVLVNGDYQAIIYLKGVDKNYNTVSSLKKHIERGQYDLGTTDNPALVVGVGIENAVGADPESNLIPLTIYLPNRDVKNFNSMDAMYSSNVNVTGTFTVQQEFDNKYAFTNLPFLQYMLNLEPHQFSGVELALQPGTNMIKIKELLLKALGPDFKVQTRYEQNQSLFTVMQVEKWVIYGILSLILLIAAFNMIGSLTMLVLEKQKDIAVLKAMGANNNLIQNIFLSEGFVLAGVGGFSGMLIAFLVCAVQMKFKLIKLEGGTFIIDYYPVKMVPPDFFLVGFTVFVVALLAAYLPARKAGTQFFSLKS